MLKNKMLFCLISIMVGVAIGFTVTMYFNFWKEPKAMFVKTDNPKLTKIRQDLQGLKAELRQRGVYNCCIRNDCDWCALHMGHCPCAEMIQKKGKEKSCPECAAAWNRKRGKIPGVDPDAVEVTTFGIYGFKEGGQHQIEEHRH